MEAEKFSRAYEKGPRTDWEAGRSERDETAEEAFAPLREWGDFFNVLSDEIMTGTPNHEQTRQSLLAFYAYLNENLGKLKRMTFKMLKENPKLQHYRNELNFYIMSHASIALWDQAATPDKVIEPWYMTSAQTELAIEAMEVQRERAELAQTNPDLANTVFGGQINEIDAYIAMLEMCKDDPYRFSVLPSPPKYESNRISSINSDFLLMDRDVKQVRGVQVKTYVRDNGYRAAVAAEEGQPAPLHSSAYGRYDHSRVSLIDAVTDLGNSKSTWEYRPSSGGHTKKVWLTVSDPGKISQEHLARTTNEDMNRLTFSQNPKIKQYALGLRSQARQRFKLNGQRPFIATAVGNIKGRLFGELYETPAEKNIVPTDDIPDSSLAL